METSIASSRRAHDPSDQSTPRVAERVIEVVFGATSVVDAVGGEVYESSWTRLLCRKNEELKPRGVSAVG
jgi:hypothetical protein